MANLDIHSTPGALAPRCLVWTPRARCGYTSDMRLSVELTPKQEQQLAAIATDSSARMAGGPLLIARKVRWHPRPPRPGPCRRQQPGIQQWLARRYAHSVDTGIDSTKVAPRCISLSTDTRPRCASAMPFA